MDLTGKVLLALYVYCRVQLTSCYVSVTGLHSLVDAFAQPCSLRHIRPSVRMRSLASAGRIYMKFHIGYLSVNLSIKSG